VKRTRKSNEPSSLSDYRSTAQAATWGEFCGEYLDAYGLDSLRSGLRSDQGGLCSYCEVKLGSERGAAQVEHFHPKDPTRKCCSKYGWRDDWGVYWRNLLAVCRGGEGSDDLSCDKPKANNDLCAEILNPLEMSTVAYFDFQAMSGRICVGAACPSEEVELAEETIRSLGLDCGRLNRQRADVLNSLNSSILERAALLEETGLGPDAAFEESMRLIAEAALADPSDWPPFFSVYRWVLGDAAEQVLTTVAYQG
jgi:uncharacterized protein (TIGR02646 family)